MTIEEIPIDTDDLVLRHVLGESEKALAESFGISRYTIRKRLLAAGVEPRGKSAAMYVRMAKTTSRERASLTAAAHAAVRGKKQSLAQLEAHALGREGNLGKTVSAAEIQLAEMLRANGYNIIQQKAIGKYNVDVATGSVAVEILGGGWHGSKSHGERLRYLLDSGWDVIYIWVDQINFPLGPDAAEYVISHIKFRESNPAESRCYRVIRGSGKFIAGGSLDRDDIPDVIPYTDLPDVPPAEIPFGFCHCGCGRETTRYPTSNATKGIRRGDPHLYISGHNNRGRNPRRPNHAPNVERDT